MKQKMMLNKDQRGFSLIELIIVMAIMAVLLALLVPRLSRYLERSRSAACLADMSQIAKEYAIDQYLEADIPDGLIQKIADEYGAVKAAGSSRAYTGLCPSGGIYVFDNYADGSLLLTCTKHPENGQWDFSAALTTTVIQNMDSIIHDNKKLSAYLSVSNKEIDSEATATGADGTSWAQLIKNEMGGTMLASRSWKLTSTNNGYVVYVTIDAKTIDKMDPKDNPVVGVMRYEYDKSGILLSAEATEASVKAHTVTYTNANKENVTVSYNILATKK